MQKNKLVTLIRRGNQTPLSVADLLDTTEDFSDCLRFAIRDSPKLIDVLINKTTDFTGCFEQAVLYHFTNRDLLIRLAKLAPNPEACIKFASDNYITNIDVYMALKGKLDSRYENPSGYEIPTGGDKYNIVRLLLEKRGNVTDEELEEYYNKTNDFSNCLYNAICIIPERKEFLLKLADTLTDHLYAIALCCKSSIDQHDLMMKLIEKVRIKDDTLHTLIDVGLRDLEVIEYITDNSEEITGCFPDIIEYFSDNTDLLFKIIKKVKHIPSNTLQRALAYTPKSYDFVKHIFKKTSFFIGVDHLVAQYVLEYKNGIKRGIRYGMCVDQTLTHAIRRDCDDKEFMELLILNARNFNNSIVVALLKENKDAALIERLVNEAKTLNGCVDVLITQDVMDTQKEVYLPICIKILEKTPSTCGILLKALIYKMDKFFIMKVLEKELKFDKCLLLAKDHEVFDAIVEKAHSLQEDFTTLIATKNVDEYLIKSILKKQKSHLHITLLAIKNETLSDDIVMEVIENTAISKRMIDVETNKLLNECIVYRKNIVEKVINKTTQFELSLTLAIEHMPENENVIRKLALVCADSEVKGNEIAMDEFIKKRPYSYIISRQIKDQNTLMEYIRKGGDIDYAVAKGMDYSFIIELARECKDSDKLYRAVMKYKTDELIDIYIRLSSYFDKNIANIITDDERLKIYINSRNGFEDIEWLVDRFKDDKYFIFTVMIKSKHNGSFLNNHFYCDYFFKQTHKFEPHKIEAIGSKYRNGYIRRATKKETALGPVVRHCLYDIDLLIYVIEREVHVTNITKHLCKFPILDTVAEAVLLKMGSINPVARAKFKSLPNFGDILKRVEEYENSLSFIETKIHNTPYYSREMIDEILKHKNKEELLGRYLDGMFPDSVVLNTSIKYLPENTDLILKIVKMSSCKLKCLPFFIQNIDYDKRLFQDIVNRSESDFGLINMAFSAGKNDTDFIRSLIRIEKDMDVVNSLANDDKYRTEVIKYSDNCMLVYKLKPYDKKAIIDSLLRSKNRFEYIEQAPWMFDLFVENNKINYDHNAYKYVKKLGLDYDVQKLFNVTVNLKSVLNLFTPEPEFIDQVLESKHKHNFNGSYIVALRLYGKDVAAKLIKHDKLYEKYGWDNFTMNDQCQICLCDIDESEPLVYMECGHVTHNTCYKKDYKCGFH